MADVFFHGALQHTHTSIHGLSNQALRTERLPVTIWKEFRRNQRARLGGLVYLLSVSWKSTFFVSVCGRSVKAGSISCESWVVGVEVGFLVFASLQLGTGRMAVCGLKRTCYAGGWVPSVLCTRVVAAAASKIAILVFQRGLGQRYIRGER